MPNAIAYVDGFNLFHGLEEAGLKQFYWLDLHAVSQKIMAAYGYNITLVRYFTSRVQHTHPAKQDQDIWLLALKEQALVQTHFGDFRGNPCRKCASAPMLYFEKGTDVNLAVWMMHDVTQRMNAEPSLDAILLITGDSDQLPAVHRIKAVAPGFPVYIAFPPCRNSRSLGGAAGKGRWLDITPTLLSGCCMPDSTPKGISRPAHWV